MLAIGVVVAMDGDQEAPCMEHSYGGHQVNIRSGGWEDIPRDVEVQGKVLYGTC